MYPFSICSDNIVIGETADTTIPVQTPAVDFILENNSVSEYNDTCYTILLFRLRLILEK